MQEAAKWHTRNGGVLFLLSLTVRHGLGDDLKQTRAGVAKAWKRVQAGAPWKRFKQRIGMRGAIRAMEVTVGPNGFHPHLHVLLLLDSISSSDLDAARLFLGERWRMAVSASIGDDAVPDALHGCDLRPCMASGYLTKLGLAMELVAPADKLGRSANRSPLQVAVDFIRTGDESDALLWQSYCGGMRGARMLTWTVGLRATAGIGVERTDAEIVEGTQDDEHTVYSIPGNVWDACRDHPGFAYLVFEAAERGGAEEVNKVIRDNSAIRLERRWLRI